MAFAIDIAMVRDLMDIDGWKMMYQDAESDFFRNSDAKGVAMDDLDNEKNMIKINLKTFWQNTRYCTSLSKTKT